MKKMIVSILLLAAFAVTALADIPAPKNEKTPKPKKTRTINTMLYIHLDQKAADARLIIPKGRIKELRAALDGLDSDSEQLTAAKGFSGVQTVVSGLFLSLAFVFGGVWLIRRDKLGLLNGKAFIIGTGLILTLTGAALVLANAPPPIIRSIQNGIFSKDVNAYKFASGKIILEASDKEEEVILIVPVTEEKKAETDKATEQ